MSEAKQRSRVTAGQIGTPQLTYFSGGRKPRLASICRGLRESSDYWTARSSRSTSGRWGAAGGNRRRSSRAAAAASGRRPDCA